MHSKTTSWVLLVLLSLVWGSSFILMKRGMDAFSSSEVAAMRISMAFLVLFPVFVRHFKPEFKSRIVPLMLTGVFGNLIPAFLFTLAETRINSGLAGMLNALTPVFTMLLSIFWLRIRVSRHQILGLAGGLLAACGLMVFEPGHNKYQNISYGLLVILATVCYAISVNVIKKYLGKLSAIGTTAWAFTITGPLAMTYLFGFSHFTSTLISHPQALSALAYTAILAVVGSALSVIAYNYLIKHAGTVFASSCTYLIPVVAIFWGYFDGESVNFYQILCVLVIIFSVYLVNKD
ncbi:MAG TPA: DMT family transporter [Bacteroidia bacterium]|nr:DMT family transporter [Bacteroidia bacterium]